MSRPDLTGQRFGRLTVLGLATPNGKPGRRWLCRCDCGNENTPLTYSLKSGTSKSCGCLARERASKSRERPWTAEEFDMLHLPLPSGELKPKLGRSKVSIRLKRRELGIKVSRRGVGASA